tara:strand:- start:1532 stop:2002 length:471 start_codon:yes stop_codon:yes gene_type:complete
MRTWLNTLDQRDQIALLTIVVFITGWLIFQGLFAPISAKRVQMEINNVSAAELLARVDVKVAQLMALRDQSDSASGGSLTAIISRSSEALQLPVKRLQPNSRGEVQVRFEDVDYDTFVQWLHRAETSDGLAIIDLSISQAGRRGRVNASVQVVLVQ